MSMLHFPDGSWDPSKCTCLVCGSAVHVRGATPESGADYHWFCMNQQCANARGEGRADTEDEPEWARWERNGFAKPPRT